MNVLVEQFAREMEPLLRGEDGMHGAVHHCATVDDAGNGIVQRARELSLARIVVAAREELDPVARILAEAAGREGFVVERDHPAGLDPDRPDSSVFPEEGPRDPHAYASFDAGVGGADVLVAESASIGLVAGPHEARALSLLPPVHFVVAPVSRLVARIHDALERLVPSPGSANSPSITFITGPSRTADIEKILVLPAHGPSRLYLWLVEG